jgi:hypothetical protein
LDACCETNAGQLINACMVLRENRKRGFSKVIFLSPLKHTRYYLLQKHFIYMNGKKYFLNAFKGQFSEKQRPGEHATAFQEITGHLVNINFKNTDYGEAMRLHFVDENNFYMVSMFVSSRPANAFFMLVKNLDLHSPMTLKIKSENGKDFFNIEQYGAQVQWYYTAENSQPILYLNYEEKRAFMRNMIQQDIIPALAKKINPLPYHAYYKPARKGLQGRYFSDFKSGGVNINPIGEAEQKYYDEHGKP